MRAGSLIAAAGALLALAAPGCGGDSGEDAGSTAPPADTTSIRPPTPASPSGPATPREPDQGGAAGEASPEAPATGPETGELPGSDEGQVAATVTAYVSALNRHDAPASCALFAPGALRLSELPERRDGCEGSLRASIGTRPSGRGPAWKHTRIAEITAVSVAGGGVRATATVVHRFSDRRQPSIEEDVVYLERTRGRWLLAKPSTTFYRAVGYADPPLRALTPP